MVGWTAGTQAASMFNTVAAGECGRVIFYLPLIITRIWLDMLPDELEAMFNREFRRAMRRGGK